MHNISKALASLQKDTKKQQNKAQIDQIKNYIIAENKEKLEIKNILKSIKVLDKACDTNKSENFLIEKFSKELHRTIKPKFTIALMRNLEKESKPLEIKYELGNTNSTSKNNFIKIAKKSLNQIKVTKHKNSKFKGIYNYMVVPLGINHIEGIFILGNKTNSFSNSDLNFAIELENIFDSILEHSRTFHSVEKKKNELEVLYKIDQIRDSSKDFNDMIKQVLIEFHKIIKAKSVFITLYNYSGDFREIQTYPGKIKTSIPTIKKISKKVILNKTISFNNNTNLIGIYNWIAIPLVLNDVIIGVLGAINAPGKGFNKYHKDMLHAIGSQVDTAIFEDFEITSIKKIFKRYVSDKVVEEMITKHDSNFLTGHKQNLSILFADIRRFTDMSEELDPEILVTIVNEYIRRAADEIFKLDGTVDKIVGDEVMALFGAPVYHKDHPITAVKTAIAIMKAIKKMKLPASSLHAGQLNKKYKINIGIGINSGEAVVGNIGCEKVSDYTALGNNVNIAARLCGKAEENQILISEATYKHVKTKFKVKFVGNLEIKGIKKPMKVYEILYR